jgi:hypothetical protein
VSLTPKNWKSFQHYKDRAPIWIKLHRSLLDDFDYHRLPVASKALAPMLWLLASEYEGGEITASNEEIAFRFRMSAAELEAALTPLIEREFFLSHAPLAQRKPDAMPEKRREETEQEKKEETETKTDSRPAAGADRPVRASRFDAFMQAYPRRDGANPRKPAEKKYNALVRSGADEQLLIDEARTFAAQESARGNTGTRFIPMAVTWLNQERFSDIAAIGFLTAAQQSPALQLETAVKFYARTRVWSRHAGPAPGEPGCRAPPELLVRYGLGVDGRRVEGVVG